MDRLVESTLKYGLVPPVVMEFPGITAGGGYAGTSGESSSFKHGFFDKTINSVEMVLANGDTVTASSTENSDLFHGAAGAVGSLGITTLIELQLIEAKKYVKVTYHPRRSVAETIESLRDEISDFSNDYVDGILYSKDHGVVVTGEMTDDKPETAAVQTFSHPFDPWFYLHVKDKTLSRSSPAVTEYIPLAEYLFRYDRGGFWVGASAFEYFKFPFNRYTRWFLDDFLHTRMLYKALHASGESSRYVVQDLALPFSTAEAFIDYTAEKFGIWPLWLCPLRQSPQPTLHPHTGEVEADGQTPKPMLNIGVWGFGPADPDAFVAANRDLERRLRELGGMKWLYAHTYYTEQEFWEMYDREWYDNLRQKYSASTLPSVYEKVKVDVEKNRRERESWGGWLRSRWPLGGLWGIWKAIESRNIDIDIDLECTNRAAIIDRHRFILNNAKFFLSSVRDLGL
ncbi:FAD-binding protein DIMINUTO [Rasamsonia emersonii CBS 393.64]|uniref:FAD-binding protein DIMINUTO n=1 Tax=Rasamsonia emersonii (strain ATCC 16479 / CBS 393.64 / IMI 116815) TaxID=1408163 RepID=A0A0F4Z2Q6_RASE3|nr:FAD-binding protein DIMINUTO [Rasamsonia emersonii CBS 393.64]KKA24376.1 FAD-binding protein DIMINUTO [Rasamsonia emersonii CBS 393.64]